MPKVTISPPTERTVTIEMTETEARALRIYLGQRKAGLQPSDTWALCQALLDVLGWD